MIGEVLETGVVVSTVGLTYVTAYPYPIRRRHRDRVVHTARTVYVLVCYHGKWIMWQAVALIPGRLRDRGE